MGVILASFAGKALAEEALDRSAPFDLLASVAPQRFPGGTRLRSILYALGMLWYATLDRL
jgi:gamma-glutamylputrescine oxidase